MTKKIPHAGLRQQTLFIQCFINNWYYYNLYFLFIFHRFFFLFYIFATTDFKHNKPCNYSTRLVLTILSSFFACLSLIYFLLYFFFVIMYALRTVPTKYQGFCATLGPRGKSRSLKGLLDPQRKPGVAMHFFEIISLESQQKC